MKQQHHPTDKKSFEKGINSDANKELLGVREGEHVDARNMRSVSMDGDNFAKKKIKGEEVLYPNVDNRCTVGTGLPLSDDYECMMTQEINGHIVEAWAVDPAVSTEPSLMRIDGKIVLMSTNFPIRVDFPLEYHKNETCIGGEFYITDYNSRPMVFNVKDLLLNSGVSVGSETGACSDKYFDSFNINENIVGVSSSLFKIAFIKQANIGGLFDEVFGSQGLLVGMYSYSYRYATAEGDRSGWSPVSEMIPVIRSISNISPEYPKMGNYSSDPNLTSPTTYGNHLKIKYDNTNSFDFIEVRRDGWYAGNTLNTPPISDIIGAFSVSPGLNTVDVLDYSTPNEAEDTLTEEDLVDVAESIQAAKAIRYYNSKLWLMNVKYREKDIEDTIDFVDVDDRIVPTIQKIGKKGHVDTFNAAYFKSNMRGEANGFGLFLYDDAGAKSYATSIVDNFQFPNRRDPVSTETLGNSYFGVVKAADTNGAAPNNTHEVFDHATAKRRAIVPGEVAKEKNSVLPYFNPTSIPPVIGTWAQPTLVNILDNQVLGTSTSPYKPLHPVGQTDPSSDLNRRVNTHVYTDNGYSSTAIPYNPECFGIDYYAMGAAFSGINTETLPDWADGFSVVQTNPAKRVIAQGLGFYSLISCEDGIINGFGPNGAKESHALLCNFPDLDQQTGLTPELVTGLIGPHGVNSPYRLQVVSPLGFFTEFYSYFANSFSAKRKAIDAIAYVRILEDRGQINPLWDGNIGLNNYVGFGSWRSASDNSSKFPFNTNPGLFTIDTITEAPTSNSSAVNLHISLTEAIYSTMYTGSASENGDFWAEEMKKWLEPMYVVNLVKDDAFINPGLLSEFNYTGHYIKLRSKIIESDGAPTQTATLISERWEDCTRDFVGQVNNAYSNLERFTFVGIPGGVENRWLDVTGKTPAVVGVLQANIALFGFDTVTDASGSYNVYGVYTVTQTYDGSSPVFTLSFDNLPIGVDVFVNYDKRIPVRVFGGDTYVNDHIFPVLDNTYTSEANPQDPTHDFSFNVPFPYPMYALNVFIGLVGNVKASFGNSRYLTNTLTNTGGGFYGGNILEGHIYFDSSFLGSGFSGFKPSKWRQLVAMWTAETRINLSFAFNVEITKTEEDTQFFPLKHYVYRPGKWNSDFDPNDTTGFLDENNIYDGYYGDYGREWENWGHGGFRFRQAVNIDYSKKQTGELVTTIPALGFDEEVDYCTRILWSVTRPINVQDTPTVKTFPPANFYDISDNTGEIKFAWDADSAKGNNLYALTNNGVCLVLVDKRILSEINSSELATMGTDIGGVAEELWINKEIGMDNETWRSWAEYANVLFWTNSTASYMMGDNKINNITDNGYSHMLRTKYISKANEGVDSKISGVYDILHKEYYVTADEKEKNEFSTLIYGVSQESLQCQSDYRYDKYLSINNKVYGMKGMETFELGVGNLLNGDEYECYVSGVSNADSYSDKEFIRIRVNSHSKPKRIEFYSDYDMYLSGTPSSIVDAVVNPLNIKDYHGYECYIPRKTLTPFNREQGRLVIFKIVSDEDEEFFISTAGIQYKILK